jgi:hypothetical protein
MKKISALLFFFILTFILTQNVLAEQFSQSFVRLNSNKSTAPLSGTICATPSTAVAGVEAKVKITFPNDFTISSTALNFTTNTTNLPAGATAWPGIGGSAISINSKTVTLASGDLTNASALYCFNFTASSSTTGGLGNKEGNLTTTNSSDVSIDSSNYGLNIVPSDQISVTATVPADPLDFINSLSKITPANDYSRNSRIDYQINYGSLLSTNTDLVIEASWTQGTIEGDSVPSVNVVNYYTGSATDAYGDTPPVIDTVNRKITWSIPTFPASLTNQNVRFSLQTVSSYTPGVKSSFTVSARLLPPGTATTFKQITSYLDPNIQSTATSESTSTSTTTPSTTTTTATTQTTTPINTIDMNTISSDNVAISINTYSFSDVEVRYGTNLNELNQRITSENSTAHTVTLTELLPETKYYFRIYVTEISGSRFTSEIYTFKTAKDSDQTLVNTITLVATSNDTIISSITQGGNDTLVIPTDSDFQIKFAMQERASVNSLQVNLENNDVLGASSFPPSANAAGQSVNVIETISGIYSGNLKSSPKPGTYILMARIYDKSGNISEQELATVKVVNKFTIISKSDKTPVEGARVFLYFYTPSTKTYKEIPASSIEGGNPLFTNRNGQLDLVLPQGRYKAEISDLRHRAYSVEFEIGPKNGQEFPVVELEGTKITLFSLFHYFRLSINDVFLKNTKEYSQILTGSSRFFDLIALISLGALVLITLTAFSKRHHVPLFHIPSYFYYLLDRNDKNEKYIHGVIYDEGNNPVTSANVYLSDRVDDKIIAHKKSNKYGEFFFKKENTKKEYLLMAMAKGYQASPVFEYHEKAHLKFKITLKKEEEGLHIFGRFTNYLSVVTGLSFEVLLVISFIFEILFINSFGVVKTFPFLAITALNLFLWIMHLRSKTQIKVSEEYTT